MTATQSLNLYNIAFRYFKNEADASSFVKEIEVVVDNKFDNKKETIASKEDIALLRIEAKEQKVDIIKWMVALVLSSIGITTTLIAFLLNYYLKK